MEINLPSVAATALRLRWVTPKNHSTLKAVEAMNFAVRLMRLSHCAPPWPAQCCFHNS
jgi:hypothetical protein